jgi:hypothetical protein
MLNYGNGTTALVTADAQTVATGYIVRVYAIHIISGGGGAAVVSFKSGGSGGTTYLTETGTASTGKTITYGEGGIVFPAGLYVDVDANTTSVAVTYNVTSA